MILSKRTKIFVMALIVCAIIFVIFGIVILIQVYTYNNYPTGMKNGDTFVYGYEASYTGDKIGQSYIISDGLLTVGILNIGPTFINISLNNQFTFNGSFNSTNSYMAISTTDVNFPFFYNRDDSAARFDISSYTVYAPSGENFGWSGNPRYYEVGYYIGAGNWYINSKTVVLNPAGVFATFQLVNHNIQVNGDILLENKTTIYVEEATGVIVKSEYFNLIKNLTSGSELYRETETINLLHTTTYVFPLLSGMLIFLDFGEPIILFLERYFMIIVSIILIILIVYLWRKTSAFRRD